MARRRTTKSGTGQTSPIRRYAPTLLLLLPVLGFGAWQAVLFVGDTAPKLKPILSEYGYTALTPPSRFFGPGTFILVESLKDGSMKLHLACNMDQAALESLWQRSKTLDQSFVTKVRDGFEASAEALKLATSRAKGTAARDVDVSLHDISILTMPYEGLFGIREKYLRGSCEDAVIWNLRAGASVCQTEEALEADILYSAKSADDIAGSAGVQPAGSATIDRQASQENHAEGDDLILGVRVRMSACFFLEDNGKRLAGWAMPRPATTPRS